MSAIPASDIVAVYPNVLGAGGSALDLTGLILSTSTRVPLGQVLPFSSATAVAAYFGSGSDEAAKAAVYFAGYGNSTAKPGSVLFAQYNSAAVAAYIRGGSITLAEVNAITSGALVIVSNGVTKTSSALDLSAASSLSNAATTITAAFTSPGFAVTYDSVSGGFLVTSSTTGASSTLSVTAGANATALKLTSATGAVSSPGAIAAVPGTFMDSLKSVTQAWCSFCTLFEPSTSDCVAFALWNNDQGRRFHYAMWDSDSAPTVVPDTTSAGYQIREAGYEGVSLLYSASADKAVFLCGAIASINFTAVNGRATLAFKSQSGLIADVTTQTVAANLLTNGYNFYGSYASAANGWSFYSNGSVTGDFLWLDSYVNQIWMNDAFQVALMDLLTTVGSIPYNTDGDGLIEAAMADPITAAVNFGAIRPNVPLSASQIASVNTAAGGIDIASVIQTRGWYLQILPATAAVRAARGSPPINFWYTDGQSVQRITLASIQIQ